MCDTTIDIWLGWSDIWSILESLFLTGSQTTEIYWAYKGFSQLVVYLYSSIGCKVELSTYRTLTIVLFFLAERGSLNSFPLAMLFSGDSFAETQSDELLTILHIGGNVTLVSWRLKTIMSRVVVYNDLWGSSGRQGASATTAR
jgi:hypothetical protein